MLMITRLFIFFYYFLSSNNKQGLKGEKKELDGCILINQTY